MARKKSGFRDFLDGFNGTYGAFNKVARDYETAGVMEEDSSQYDQYSPEQAAQIQKNAEAGMKNPYEGLTPDTKRYSYGSYDGTSAPTEQQMLGLRTAKLANIASKYGDHEGAMRMRKEAADIAWQEKSRRHEEIKMGREEDAFAREDNSRAIQAQTAQYSPEAYDATSGRLQELEAQGADISQAKGLYAQHFTKTPVLAQKEAAAQLYAAGDTTGANDALKRAKFFEEEGMREIVQAVRSGVKGAALAKIFNSAGNHRVDGPISVKKVGDDFVLRGSINGKTDQLRLSTIESAMMTPLERENLAISKQKNSHSKGGGGEGTEKIVNFVDKVTGEARPYTFNSKTKEFEPLRLPANMVLPGKQDTEADKHRYGLRKEAIEAKAKLGPEPTTGAFRPDWLLGPSDEQKAHRAQTNYIDKVYEQVSPEIRTLATRSPEDFGLAPPAPPAQATYVTPGIGSSPVPKGFAQAQDRLRKDAEKQARIKQLEKQASGMSPENRQVWLSNRGYFDLIGAN